MGLAIKQHIIICALRHKARRQPMSKTQHSRHIRRAFRRNLVQATARHTARHMSVKIRVNFCKTGGNRRAALHDWLMLGDQPMQALQLVLSLGAFGLPAFVKRALHVLRLFLLKCSYFVLK
jgi:hypothetical protein